MYEIQPVNPHAGKAISFVSGDAVSVTDHLKNALKMSPVKILDVTRDGIGTTDAIESQIIAFRGYSDATLYFEVDIAGSTTPELDIEIYFTNFPDTRTTQVAGTSYTLHQTYTKSASEVFPIEIPAGAEYLKIRFVGTANNTLTKGYANIVTRKDI